jgi:hypothetical protein
MDHDNEMTVSQETFDKIQAMIGMTVAGEVMLTIEDVVETMITLKIRDHHEKGSEYGPYIKQLSQLKVFDTRIVNSIVEHANAKHEMQKREFARERLEYQNQINKLSVCSTGWR